MWKKIIVGIALLALVILAFLSWYKIHYSMDFVESFEVNTPEPQHRVLIATQGSEFKNAVVAEVINYLKQRHVDIKVVDVSALPQVKENNWDAVVVIHTWENMKPQADARAYLDGVKDLSNVVVLATSGRGSYKIAGIHAISSASVMSDVPARVDDLKRRLDAILQKHIEK